MIVIERGGGSRLPEQVLRFSVRGSQRWVFSHPNNFISHNFADSVRCLLPFFCRPLSKISLEVQRVGIRPDVSCEVPPIVWTPDIDRLGCHFGYLKWFLSANHSKQNQAFDGALMRGLGRAMKLASKLQWRTWGSLITPRRFEGGGWLKLKTNPSRDWISSSCLGMALQSGKIDSFSS